MSHVIGHGRYGREVYPVPGGGGGTSDGVPPGVEPQIVTYAPGTNEPVARDRLQRWTPYVSDDLLAYFNTTNLDGNIGSEGDVRGAWRILGAQSIDFDMVYTIGGAGFAGTGSFTFRIKPENLPSTFNDGLPIGPLVIQDLYIDTAYLLDSSTPANNAIGILSIAPDFISVIVNIIQNPGGTEVGNDVDADSPFVWAAPDQILIRGSATFFLSC